MPGKNLKKMQPQGYYAMKKLTENEVAGLLCQEESNMQ